MYHGCCSRWQRFDGRPGSRQGTVSRQKRTVAGSKRSANAVARRRERTVVGAELTVGRTILAVCRTELAVGRAILTVIVGTVAGGHRPSRGNIVVVIGAKPLPD